MDVSARLEHVRDRIGRAAERAGRAPADVQLVAVSKLQPLEAVRAAYAAGQRDFGENYAQHLRDRARALADLPGIRWHAVGPLQTNKVKYVAEAAAAFHALDRFEVAAALSHRRAADPIPCFVEVNVSGEATKHGLPPGAVGGYVDLLRALHGIRVVGLMTMPPYGETEASRRHFGRLKTLALELGLSGLSMGTTDDFEVAIAEGATVVRVGREIFGDRP